MLAGRGMRKRRGRGSSHGCGRARRGCLALRPPLPNLFLGRAHAAASFPITVDPPLRLNHAHLLEARVPPFPRALISTVPLRVRLGHGAVGQQGDIGGAGRQGTGIRACVGRGRAGCSVGRRYSQSHRWRWWSWPWWPGGGAREGALDRGPGGEGVRFGRGPGEGVGVDGAGY